TKPDTDGDGLTDKEEVDAGSNPLDPDDPTPQGFPSTVSVVGIPSVGEVLTAESVCPGTCTAAPDQYQWQIETACVFRRS
ncbi:thrombospondin type 3 repeat-containing protein, partial [Aeromonas hydrophila]|uniref:thrombospondin type 3 repeat-containing protein n=1 Tax=Aeromonas hydrophila TaxID=644 RepID=UPI003D1A9E71